MDPVQHAYVESWKGTRPYAAMNRLDASINAACDAVATMRDDAINQRLEEVCHSIDSHAVWYADIASNLHELKKQFEEHAEEDSYFPLTAKRQVCDELRWRYDGLLNAYAELLQQADDQAFRAGVFDELFEHLRVQAETVAEERLMHVEQITLAYEGKEMAYLALSAGNAFRACEILSKALNSLPAT